MTLSIPKAVLKAELLPRSNQSDPFLGGDPPRVSVFLMFERDLSKSACRWGVASGEGDGIGLDNQWDQVLEEGGLNTNWDWVEEGVLLK